jgi:menaquinone-dependent protoporphyrinogen oxidase
MNKVLVVYASKYGSTAEIARAIGAALAADGVPVDVRAARDVSSLDGYDAVIAGSGVYVGRWHEDGTHFLKRFESELCKRQTWLFSSGPTGGSKAADVELAKAVASPETYPMPKDVDRRAARIGARGHATFPGKTGEYMGGFFGKWIPRGDWRDFDAIKAWAHGVAASLSRVAVPTA